MHSQVEASFIPSLHRRRLTPERYGVATNVPGTERTASQRASMGRKITLKSGHLRNAGVKISDGFFWVANPKNVILEYVTELF
jgi:hypothetical protein